MKSRSKTGGSSIPIWSSPNMTSMKKPTIHMSSLIRPKWILLLLLGVTLLLFIYVKYSRDDLKNSLLLDLDELTERHKCPACFGVKLCPQFLQGKIELSDWTKYSISRLVNSKNIFYASWRVGREAREVVLKKLANDNELEELDKTICRRSKKHKEDTDLKCNVKEAVRYLIREYSLHSEIDPDEIPSLHGEKIGKATDILLCPSIRKMEYLVNASAIFSKGQHQQVVLANVLTNLLVNPEPLLLQAFPAQEGWPFPKYYGSCGRIAVEENAGRRLTTLYNEAFHIRAHIAKQLILIANRFGENSANFYLYMTDVSPNNFAVDDNYMVKLVDLEDIILVDKVELIYRRKKADDYEELHVSESMPCDSAYPNGSQCFSWSPDELCNRKTSDHNYYAICAGLLAPGSLSDYFPEGLLHSMPNEWSSKDSKFYKIHEYLDQCKTGHPTHGLNRIEAAQHLLSLLDQYTRENPI